jgi:hypothetical protein
VKKLIILSVVFVFLFGNLAYALAPGNAAPQEKKVKKKEVTDPMVYVTEKGKKYHKKSCKLVAQGKKGIKLSEAIAKGYTPCGACKPPAAPDPMVYIKEKGKKYHKKSCKLVGPGKKGIKLSEAVKLGLEPCKACKPPAPPKKK